MDQERTGPRLALRHALRALPDPVIVAFALAGIFEILSGDPVLHAIVLFAVPLALVWDTVRSREDSERRAAVVEGGAPGLVSAARGALALSPMLVAIGLAYAVVVGTFARWSWPASIIVGLTGACGVALAWRAPRQPPEPPKVGRAGATAWAAVFVSIGLWELTTLLLQPTLTTSSRAHPTRRGGTP